MDENIIYDAAKELADLKDFLKIKDEPKKVDRLSDEDVYAAIKKLKENWFTAENLSKLLTKMRNCSIYANADVMLSILKLFTERKPNLKFNNVSECIFQIVSSIAGYRDDINSKFKQLIDLLQFIIQNTDENDNLTLENVLKKISYCKATNMTKLLEVWNSADKHKNQSVNIDKILGCINDLVPASDMGDLLAQLTPEQKSLSFKNHKVIDNIFNKLRQYPSAENMSKLAQQLADHLTDADTTKILEITALDQSAGGIYELVTHLNLTQNHLKTILGMWGKATSQATHILKLVDRLVQIGFTFNKDSYQDVLQYLNDTQTVNDICDLLDKFDRLGVKPKKNLNLVDSIINKLAPDQTVGDVCNLLDKFDRLGVKPKKNLNLVDSIDSIINKLAPNQTLGDVCNLLDKFDRLGVKPKENLNLVDNIINKLAPNQTVDDICNLLDKFKNLKIMLNANIAINIVSKLESDLAVDNVKKLLQKLQDLNVQLNLNKVGYNKDNVVYAIVNKCKSQQSAHDLLKLVKDLQSFKIKPTSGVCLCIVNMLGNNKDASEVVDLLIALGKLVGFDKGNDILPGIDDILLKIQDNQSKDSIIKLAKVLIAMGKNLALYPVYFRKKLEDYAEGAYNVNDEENQDLEELLTLNPKDPKYKENQTKFVKEFTKEKKEFEEKKEDKQSEEKLIPKFETGNDDGNIIANSEDGNINQSDYIIEEKINQTNGASNKKAVLKILGVALAILGILCIILSLTIASEVLLSLLIPGCVLFTAGISILVGLFYKHKHDKPIDLSSGYEQPISIGENGNIYDIEQQYPLRKEQEYDDNGSTYQNNDGF